MWLLWLSKTLPYVIPLHKPSPLSASQTKNKNCTNFTQKNCPPNLLPPPNKKIGRKTFELSSQPSPLHHRSKGLSGSLGDVFNVSVVSLWRRSWTEPAEPTDSLEARRFTRPVRESVGGGVMLPSLPQALVNSMVRPIKNGILSNFVPKKTGKTSHHLELLK